MTMAQTAHDRDHHRLPDLAFMILGYVAMHPDGVHGYQLGRALSCSPVGLPSLRLGQVYRVLHHLEHLGLLGGRVEVGTSRPSRYRFTVTARGAAAFGDWLTAVPRGPLPLRDQVLNRLRFAARLPRGVLAGFLREAIDECEAELDDLARAGDGVSEPRIGGRPVLSLAVKMRLAADRGWLTEAARLLVEEGKPGETPREQAGGSAQRPVAARAVAGRQ
jgi:DNA-binding PadR family transcriptional regulator